MIPAGDQDPNTTTPTVISNQRLIDSLLEHGQTLTVVLREVSPPRIRIWHILIDDSFDEQPVPEPTLDAAGKL